MDNITDISTIVAVESNFHRESTDPWVTRATGSFADLVVYSSRLRYVLPTPKSPSVGQIAVPALLQSIKEADSSVLAAEQFQLQHLPELRQLKATEFFDYFIDWALAHRVTLSAWLRLHSREWVREGHLARIRRPLAYPLGALRSHPRLDWAAHTISVPAEALLYAFDVALRYPLYGSLAGEHSIYLHHPLRDALLPKFDDAASGPEMFPVALSFSRTMTQLAQRVDMVEFVSTLLTLRDLVHDVGLHRLPPGQVDIQVARDIAATAKLPPRLRSATKVLNIGAATLGALAAIVPSTLGITLSAMSVTALLWNGNLPRGVASARWLRWAIDWDLGGQVPPLPQ